MHGQQDEAFDFLLKVVIIGDSGVGKSNLLQRFTKNEFFHESKSTIGVDFAAKAIQCKDYSVKAQFWDTAGQDKYRAITSAYYKNAQGAILVYDISSMNSFKNCVTWLKEVRQYAEAGVQVLMLGNKTDLQDKRQVQTDDAREYAKANNMFFMEVSALENEDNCVDKSFMILVEDILEKKEKEFVTESNVEQGDRINLGKEKEPKKKCAC